VSSRKTQEYHTPIGTFRYQHLAALSTALIQLISLPVYLYEKREDSPSAQVIED